VVPGLLYLDMNMVIVPYGMTPLKSYFAAGNIHPGLKMGLYEYFFNVLFGSQIPDKKLCLLFIEAVVCLIALG